MKKKCLFFFFLGICSLYAQPFDVINYNRKDGLSSSIIYDIAQDSTGYIWIGTDFGLNRFDGVSFVQYNTDKGLPGPAVLSIQSINKSCMLLGVFNWGLQLYNPLSGQSFPISNSIKSHVYPVILGKKSLAVGSRIGEFEIGFYPNYNQLYKIPNTKAFFYDALEIEEKLFIASSSGLFRVDNHPGSPPVLSRVLNEKMYVLSSSSDSSFWAGSDGKILKINKYTIRIENSVKLNKPGEKLNCLLADSKGRIWATTTSPCILYVAYKNNKGGYDWQNLNYLMGPGVNYINDIMEDRDGNIWIATYNKGVYCIPHIRTSVRTTSHKDWHIISAAIDDNGFRYISTVDGAFVLDSNANQKAFFKNPANTMDYIYGFIQLDNKMIASSQVEDRKTFVAKDKMYFLRKRSRSTEKVGNDKVWMGGWDNDIRICKRMKDDLIIDKYIQLPGGYSYNRINDLLYDSLERIVWCGADNGLFVIDPDSHVSAKINHPLLNTHINSLAAYKNYLLVGTNHGLIIYNEKSILNIKNIGYQWIGSVNRIMVDSKGRIYAATNFGLFIYYRQKIFIYNESLGLCSNEVTDLVLKEKSDLILIATNEGYSELHITRFFESYPLALKPIVDHITMDGQTYVKNGYYNLGSGDHSVTIQYGSLQFNYPGAIIYRYRINGKEWVQTTSQRLDIPSFSLGENKVEIQASIDKAHYSDSLELIFYRPYPVYLTPVFLSISGVVFLFICVLIMQLRIKYIDVKAKKQIEAQELLNALKHQSLNASINPHFIFNALNSIQHYIHNNNRKSAGNYLAKFARLIRMTLDKSQQMEVSVEYEVQRLDYYLQLEQARFSDHPFTYEIKAEGHVKRLMIPNMIVQPLVENAIVHGIRGLNNGFISIRFYKQEDQIFIEVEDNGVGFDRAPRSSHQSLGLQNIKEKMALYKNSSIIIKDKSTNLVPTQGTIITIRFSQQ